MEPELIHNTWQCSSITQSCCNTPKLDLPIVTLLAAPSTWQGGTPATTICT